MAVYNSTHTGQEIDNAVDKLKDVTKDNIDSIKNNKPLKSKKKIINIKN